MPPRACPTSLCSREGAVYPPPLPTAFDRNSATDVVPKGLTPLRFPRLRVQRCTLRVQHWAPRALGKSHLNGSSRVEIQNDVEPAALVRLPRHSMALGRHGRRLAHRKPLTDRRNSLAGMN